jgi:hypothetical protein
VTVLAPVAVIATQPLDHLVAVERGHELAHLRLRVEREQRVRVVHRHRTEVQPFGVDVHAPKL